MTRIFLGLAILDAAALLAAFGTGFFYSSEAGVPVHFTLGLYAVIGNLGLHCLVFIYFLGTGRWVKEVALAYDLPDEPLPKRTRELKRKTFPPALFAMLMPIGAAVAGMGAGMYPNEWPWPVHAGLAVAGLLVNAWAFTIEYRNVRTNAGVLDEVLREVDRIRARRGLVSNAEALQQEQR
jgi:hypothetical protein